MTILLSITLAVLAAEPSERPTLVVVVGTPGADEYEADFRRAADLWQAAAAKGGAAVVPIGDSSVEAAEGDVSDRDRLRDAITERGGSGAEPLWVVLIGHGTFDRREAKFNLRGPDVSDAELASWLSAAARPVVLINGASASGPFLNKVSGPNRIVVTATRSGEESSYSRFGGFLAEAIGDPTSDLDKDGQVSLLEAYLKAGGRVEEFYKSDARLATEHALLDDNGDGLGTPADWFRGVRAVKRAADGATLDGLRASQVHLIPGEREKTIPPEVRRRRDALELEIAALREKKAGMSEEEYYGRLEGLMVELASLYRTAQTDAETGQSAERARPASGGTP